MKIPSWFYKSGLCKIGYPIIITVKNNKGIIEVHSRPYRLSAHQLDNLIIICKYNKISYEFSGETSYDSKNTFTIIFSLIKDLKDLEESKFFKYFEEKIRLKQQGVQTGINSNLK